MEDEDNEEEYYSIEDHVDFGFDWCNEDKQAVMVINDIEIHLTESDVTGMILTLRELLEQYEKV